MRFAPVTQRQGESDEDFAARYRWAQHCRYRWDDVSGGDRLRAFKPDREPDWNLDANIRLWAGYRPMGTFSTAEDRRPPWRIMSIPPLYKPFTIRTTLRLRGDEGIGPTHAPDLDLPRYDGLAIQHVPLWALPVSLRVEQLDIERPDVGLAEIVAHAQRGIEANTSAAGITQALNEFTAGGGVSASQILALKPKTVKAALKKGAELAWSGGKWVVRFGSKVLGPVGVIGGIWDSYQFLKWLSENRGDIVPRIPTTEYNFTSGQILFRWPDGSVTVSPQTWSLEG